ncbi:MAG TPA: peroxiredoxin [Candidatus Eisenbacteria bacterium]|jgi:peroxiredoxin (alkyl hydroperoxide reductase subunit C)|nr:peroxiredoxin [Candidatus Eisenbacteria bacterium]
MSATTEATHAQTMPRIGDTAPDFKAPTTHGEIQFSEWQGGEWVVLFSHPADFTPVCSTELTEFGRRADEFKKRSVKLIGLSIDSVHSHLAWTQNLTKILNVKLPFPLIADLSTHVAQKYGMIHPGESATVTVRALFVIDPKRVIRGIIYYPLNVGRNVDEVLRLLDALQTADKNGVACPVNWKPGDKVIVPPPKTEAEIEAREKTNHEKIDFYLHKKSL